jgi:hypothetical protein
MSTGGMAGCDQVTIGSFVVQVFLRAADVVTTNEAASAMAVHPMSAVAFDTNTSWSRSRQLVRICLARSTVSWQIKRLAKKPLQHYMVTMPEKSDTVRARIPTSMQVLCIMLILMSLALMTQLGELPSVSLEVARAHFVAVTGLAAGVQIWRGRRSGATLFLVWSILVASHAVYPRPRLAAVWPVADVLATVLGLVILVVLNRGVRRVLLPSARADSWTEKHA